MSQTYNFACTQCRKTLWVGQRSILYDQPETVQFLHEHRGHPIIFDISEQFDDGYKDVSNYNRFTETVKIEYQAMAFLGVTDSWLDISEEMFIFHQNRYPKVRKIQILEEKS